MAKYHILRHLHVVNRHRFFVFLNCARCGIFVRGLLHDLSKYRPSEFLLSAKYCTGKKSPIGEERRAEGGYSTVFIYHTRRNRHHFEYWVDVTSGDVVLKPIPYQYVLEMCCDMISASRVYNGKAFSPEMPLAYFLSTEKKAMLHSASKDFVKEVLSRYRDTGFKNIRKKDTKKIYQETIKKYPPIEKILIYSKTIEK